MKSSVECIILLHGPGAVGKSTIAQELVKLYNFAHLETSKQIKECKPELAESFKYAIYAPDADAIAAFRKFENDRPFLRRLVVDSIRTQFQLVEWVKGDHPRAKIITIRLDVPLSVVEERASKREARGDENYIRHRYEQYIEHDRKMSGYLATLTDCHTVDWKDDWAVAWPRIEKLLKAKGISRARQQTSEPELVEK